MSATADTLERLIPESLAPDDVTGQATLALHVERYRFAARHARPGRVLDLACGAGYGSAILAERADLRILGVDLSFDAIDYARRHHAQARVEFAQGDAQAFIDRDGFDTIVSLETLEHVADPGRLLERFAALLRPGGRLIASVPTTPSVDLNPHHLHDFSERSIRALVATRAPGLREISSLRQTQPVSPLRVLRRDERRLRDRRTRLPAYYFAHPEAFARRVISTLRFGFSNRYWTGVFGKAGGGAT